MRRQTVVKQKLMEVNKQIRETAKTASNVEWNNLHIKSETLRWVLNVPTEEPN